MDKSQYTFHVCVKHNVLLLSSEDLPVPRNMRSGQGNTGSILLYILP